MEDKFSGIKSLDSLLKEAASNTGNIGDSSIGDASIGNYSFNDDTIDVEFRSPIFEELVPTIIDIYNTAENQVESLVMHYEPSQPAKDQDLKSLDIIEKYVVNVKKSIKELENITNISNKEIDSSFEKSHFK